MKSTDSANATARALDLLPPGDPAATDPRLLRDPKMIAQTRATREAAVDVWLAVSPLHAAPPDVLQSVMGKIAPPESVRPKASRRLQSVIAASGWAAAIVLLVCLWSKPAPAPAAAHSRQASRTPNASPDQTQAAAVSEIRIPRDGRLRDEIVRLRKQLSEASETRKTTAPRVIALNAPGAAHRSPEEVRRRIQVVLTNALRSALEAESASPSDPATLVIERGWPEAGMLKPEADGLIRHLNFPEHAWRENGLLRSENGSYYDSQNSLIWTPDPAGYGFVGRSIQEKDDLAGFHPHESEAPAEQIPPARRNPLPEGFIVENPADHTAEVIIENIPPPAAGNQHLVVLSDSSGETQTLSIPQAAQNDTSPVVQNTTTPAIQDTGPLTANVAQLTEWPVVVNMGATGSMYFIIKPAGEMSSFKLLERPVIANGQPDRIIVEGNP
jgi:hypothetical protein